MAMTPVNRDGGWSMVLETLALTDTAVLVSGSWQSLSSEWVLGQAGLELGLRFLRAAWIFFFHYLVPLLSPLRKGRLRDSGYL